MGPGRGGGRRVGSGRIVTYRGLTDYPETLHTGGMQTTVFFRFHQADAPPFAADNAWSAPWGSEFSADGTTYRCPACDGTGEDRTEPVCERCDGTGDDDGYTCRRCGGTGEDTECHDCDGGGWAACDRGYSCTRSAEELADYFQQHAGGAPADDHGHVVVFEGEHVGDGCDGEPLAVPTRVVETLTWTQFAAKHLQQEGVA